MFRIPLLTFTSLVLVVACSDRGTVPTDPTGTNAPALSKSGTLGNPQFSGQFTTCSPTAPVPSGTDHISCDYKITGGGNTESATISLTAPVLFNGQCRNNGGQIVPVKNFALTLTATQPNVTFQNGQITSSITVSLSSAQPPSARAVCPNGNWTIQNSNFAFAGNYELSALVFSGNSSVTIFSEFTL